MKFWKSALATLVVPAIVAPSIAMAAVRPSVKQIAAPAKQEHSLVTRNVRAGGKLKNENDLFLAGLPLLGLAAVAAAIVTAAVVVASRDNEASPG